MTENTNRPPEATPTEAPLESWKEIATYLKRGVRTVKRWEKHEALPVRRHLHQARSSVYAYASELETWKAARQPGFDQAPLAMPWRRPLPALGFALTLLLALVSVASGPILTPPGAAAQESGGLTARRVWAGPDVNIMGTPSPDGRFLSYVDRSTGDLAVRDLLTGTNRRVTNKGPWSQSGEFAENSTISPDSKQIAYAWRNEEGFYELRLIGLDGTEPRVLYRNEEVDYVEPGDWSPDGKHILALFSRKDRLNQIVLVSVAEGSVRVLKTLDWRYPLRMSFSPDGRYIVYDFPPKEDSLERDIFLLATDGSREIRLVEHPANDLFPVWAPDGKRIVFASDRTGSLGVWVIQVSEGQLHAAPELVKRDLGQRSRVLGVTRKGSYYYGVGPKWNDVYIAKLDPETGTVLAPPTKASKRFVGSNVDPAWSPDGQYFAYISHRGHSYALGSGIIVIRSLRTGEERELSPKLSPKIVRRDLSWSPDGRSILVMGYDKKGRQGCFRVDAKTGVPTPLVLSQPGEYVVAAVWSTHGKAIFYSRVHATVSQILVRNLETGQDTELYRTIAPAGIGQSLALSPDGRSLAFRWADGGTGSTALKVIPVEGGQARELLRVKKPDSIPYRRGLAWTPDGHHLLFGKPRQTDSPQEQTIELWRIPAEGGEPQRLGLAMENLRDVTVHPDGRRIAFSAGKEGAEVWVLENFLPKPEAQAARLEDE